MDAYFQSIKQRLSEFEELGKKGFTVFDFSPFLDLRIKANLMSELAFCLSTANSSAISGLRFQKLIENISLDDLSIKDLEKLLGNSGVRFHRKKAIYIREALNNTSLIAEILNLKGKEARDELVRNVKGLGLKEASHFLRNAGKKDVAIIDRHIARYLKEKGYINSESLTPRKYLDCESILDEIASERGMSLAELDLVIWYEKTGKVLK